MCGTEVTRAAHPTGSRGRENRAVAENRERGGAVRALLTCSAMRRRVPFFLHCGGAVVVAFAIAAASSAQANGIRHDELACEEAVKHLGDCCPGLDTQKIACEYSTGCGSTFYPALTIDDAECIESEDCGTLRADGACARAADPAHNYGAASPSDLPHEGGGDAEAIYGPGERICR